MINTRSVKIFSFKEMINSLKIEISGSLRCNFKEEEFRHLGRNFN